MAVRCCCVLSVGEWWSVVLECEWCGPAVCFLLPPPPIVIVGRSACIAASCARLASFIVEPRSVGGWGGLTSSSVDMFTFSRCWTRTHLCILLCILLDSAAVRGGEWWRARVCGVTPDRPTPPSLSQSLLP